MYARLTCRPGRGRLSHPRWRLTAFAKYAAAVAIGTVMILARVDVAEGQVDTAKPDSSRPTGLPGIITKDVSGVEDSVLPLPITVGPTSSGQEIVIDVSGVPSGASLSAGLDKGDGTWRLAPQELEGLSLTLPADFNGQISLSVSLSVVIRESIDVTVSPIADAPRLTVSDASGAEDAEIPINIEVEANPNEELSIAVARLPEGAELSGGTRNDDGSWALGPGDLATLLLKLPENYSGNAEFIVSATAVDGDDVAVTTQAATLNIMPAADNAQLVARDVAGVEDQAVPLDIAVELFDPKEQLELFLSGIPDQARLSVGEEVSAGTWAVEPEDLPSLMFTPPANFNGVQPIVVTAVTTDGATSATVEQGFQVDVAPAADEPVLVVADAVGLEDETIPLNVTARAGAPDETVSVMISDVPEGIALSAGQNSGGGEWELKPEELEGLYLLPPKDFNGELDLVAVARAADGGDVATAQAAFSVLVAPIAEQPVLDVENVAGDEDTAILLDVDVSPPAAGEGVDITLGPLPAGSTLSAGLDRGDGTWVLTPEELADLSFMPPPNYSGSIEVIAEARATDQGHSTVVAKGFVVDVASVLDAPLLVVHDVSGKEDQAVRLGLSVEPTGTDDAVEIILSGVPAGASLTKGTNIGAAEWLLQRDDLTDLELLPAENYHGSFILAVVAYASDAGEEAVSTGDFRVSVTPVADPPLLNTADAFGFEDEPVPLELSVVHTDPSEAITIQVSGVPDGAAFSSGADAGGGRWTLGADELQDLMLSLPANDNGTFTLAVSAMTKSGDDEASTGGEIEVAVAPVADPPFLTVADTSILEDETARLDIVAESTGKTDSLAVTLEGVPEGASLSAGTRNGNRWELAPGDLADLELTPPANLNGVLNLTVIATANDGDDTATVREAFEVAIAPVADPPRLFVGDVVTNEDIPVLLNIELAATGGETVLAAVSGLPQGATLSAGTPRDDNTWELETEQLPELILTPPADFNGIFGLTVTASAAESGAVDTAVVGEFVTVTVKPVADAPTLTVENTTTSKGGAIPLGVEVAPSGPTEQVSMIIAGVPDGMALSAGRNNGDGSWSLQPGQLAGLTLNAPDDFRGTIELTVSALSKEPVGNDIATSEATLEVQVGSEPLETRLETEIVGAAADAPAPTLRGLRVREAEALETRTTASASIASVEHVDMTYVTRVGANIRAQPTAESARVGGLPQGTRVQVTGRASGGSWLRIATNDGGSGFVFGELLEPIGTRPAGSAFAADADGTIETVDPATGIIILDDGQAYSVVEGVSVEGLQPGDLVTVSFEVRDNKNIVTAVTKSE